MLHHGFSAFHDLETGLFGIRVQLAHFNVDVIFNACDEIEEIAALGVELRVVAREGIADT